MHLLLFLAWKLDEVVEERMGEKGRRRTRGMGAERYERFELRCGGIWWESFWFVAFGNFYFLLLLFLFPCFWTIHCQTHTHTQTHSHTHTHSCSRHMETAWKPGFSVNIFSKQQAAHSIFLVPHVRVYFRYHCTCTPQNSLHVCTHQTPDTHTSRHKYTHTHLKHMHCFVQLVILLIFFLRCISVCSSLR